MFLEEFSLDFIFFQVYTNLVRDDDGDEEIELKIYVEEEPDKSQDNISSVIQTNSGLLCDSASSLKNNDCVCPFSVDDRADCSRHSSESALSNKIDSIKKSQKSKEVKFFIFFKNKNFPFFIVFYFPKHHVMKLLKRVIILLYYFF